MNEGAYQPGSPPAPSISQIKEQYENDKRAIEEYARETAEKYAHEVRVLNQRIAAQAEVITELERQLSEERSRAVV